MMIGKCTDRISLVVVRDEPLFFQFRDGPYYPTLRLLHRYPSMMPVLRVDKGAIKFVFNGADIMCLQEVQSDHFEDFWAPELSRRGYAAVYKKKTGEIFTGTGSGYAIDGCATFYRRDRFALVKKYEVEFNKAALSLSESVPAESRKAALNRLLKDNVALIAVLEALEPHDADAAASGKRQLVCVANTHIHANPELKDVKLWQVHTLLKGLEKIADLRQAAQHVDVRPSAEGFVDLALALDLLGAIDSAEATIRGALHRCESRGSHQRLDFEETMPEQRVNYLVELDSQGGQQVSRHPVEPVPAYLAERFEEFTEPEVEGRLLE